MIDDVRRLVAPLDLAVLDRDASTLCLVDRALRIVFVNQAWHTFALDSGASWPAAGEWGVGRRMLDAITPELRPFYARLFAEAAVADAPLEHAYECSTPTQRRRYHMRLLPCHEGHVLAIHSLAHEEPATDDHGPSDGRYRDADGIVTMCGHCRRVRRAGSAPPQWDWVAAYVAHMPDHTSHALCAVCLDYYYPR